VQEYGEAEWLNDDSQNRFLYDINVEVGTTLMRTFALSGKSMTGLTHEVRPYMEYDFVPDVDQDELPRFDSVDRIGEQNQITYGIDNFFNALSGNDSERDFGWFKIKQSYSFLSDRSDEPFSDINAELKWMPLRLLEFLYRTDFDVYDTGFVTHDFEASFRNSRGDFFELDYYFKDNGDANETEQINAALEAGIFSSWRAKLSVEHSLANDETNIANASLLYQALCWSVELGSQYTPEETSFMLIFNLANLGTPIQFYY
ncbi:MAG: LPS assembly protein LptD, partial [Desulfofustis sp.]